MEKLHTTDFNEDEIKSTICEVVGRIPDAQLNELLSLIEYKLELRKEAEARSLDYIYDENPDTYMYDKHPMIYGKAHLTKALSVLKEEPRLMIIGMSRIGKTFLTNHLVGQLAGVDTFENEFGVYTYNNTLIVPATYNSKEFRHLFAKFCTYNKESEQCYLIITEVEKSALHNLIPFLWEILDLDDITFKDRIQSGIKFKYLDMEIEIPRNIKIIANCFTKDCNKQVMDKFKNIINLDNFTPDDTKDIVEYTGIPEDIIEGLIDANMTLVRHWGEDEAFLIPRLLRVNTINELTKYTEILSRFIEKKYQNLKERIEDYISENT